MKFICYMSLVATLFSLVVVAEHQLRGGADKNEQERQLSWRQRNRDCKGKDCKSKLATFMQYLQDTRDRRENNESSSSSSSDEEELPKRIKPCLKRGDCHDDKTSGDSPNEKQEEKSEETTVTSYLKLPMNQKESESDGEESPCNKDDKSRKCKNKKKEQSATQVEPLEQSPPLDSAIVSSNTGLPCCCWCDKLPCNCHCETFQDSLLYHAFTNTHALGRRYGYSESTPCEGENCRHNGGAVHGAPEDHSVEPCVGDDCVHHGESDATPCDGNDNGSFKAPAFMCCCSECNSFPCSCSCNYFTLSRIPT